jgi:hypothetical protein
MSAVQVITIVSRLLRLAKDAVIVTGVSVGVWRFIRGERAGKNSGKKQFDTQK